MAVTEVDIRKIDPSPMNPRKHFDQGKLDELTTDIALRGVLQNVIIRSGKPGRFELVVGERRFRAAVLAKLKTIPAAIVALSDKAALETMIVENSKRADIDALEEADAYQTLLSNHSMTVEDIAERVGKSVTSVYKRLKLCELGPEGRKSFEKGVLTPSVALLVARIPDAKLQKSAVKAVTETRWADEEPMSTRKAQEHIERHYMLRLVDAPWKTNDGDLDMEAGPCSTCPKRTGNQSELFADVKGNDVCTDPTCFAKKTKLWKSGRVVEIKNAGGTILSQVESKKIIQKPFRKGDPARLHHSAGFIDLDAVCYDAKTPRSYRKVLKPSDEEIIVARAHGATMELVPDKVLKAWKKANGVDTFSHSSRGSTAADKKFRDENQQRKRREKVSREVDRRVYRHVYSIEIKRKSGGGENAISRTRFFCRSFCSNLWSDGPDIALALGIVAKKHDAPRAISKWFEDTKRNSYELRGLVSVVAVAACMGSDLAFCEKLFAFDRKVIAKQVAADVKKLAPKKRAKKKAPAKKASAKKSAKKKAGKSPTKKTAAKKKASKK